MVNLLQASGVPPSSWFDEWMEIHLHACKATAWEKYVLEALPLKTSGVLIVV